LALAGIFSTLIDMRAAEPAPQPSVKPFPALSPKQPFDVDKHKVRSLVSRGSILEAHRLFGIVSWQTFLAFNWPANDAGQPDSRKDLSDNHTWRVWNYWRSAGSIFLENGAKPPPWDDLRQNSEKLRNFANMPHSLGTTRARDNFEAFTGPLVDQNGKWVRFEIRVNKEEFNYILRNGLYSQDGQIAFSHKDKDNEVELPINKGGKHGAIEIKLAWKEMGSNDDQTRFYTTDLTVTPSEPNAKPKRIHVGLVGMHISMRTESSPEWIWSTFEQIDNVRSNPVGNGKQSHPNFVDPSYTSSDFNTLSPMNAKVEGNNLMRASGTEATTWIESLTTTPTQVKRIDVPEQLDLNPWDNKLGGVTKGLNAQVQALLEARKSVFRYYELVDVQWPLHPNAPSVPGGEGSAPASIRFKTPGEMVPTFLINTTMETYFQKGDQPAGGSEQDNRLGVPAAKLSDEGKKVVGQFGPNTLTDSTHFIGTESCVGCHYSAGIAIMRQADKDGKTSTIFGENASFGKNGSANFSWMLQQEPQPVPKLPDASTKALRKYLKEAGQRGPNDHPASTSRGSQP
jgi:hypothetical protein